MTESNLPSTADDSCFSNSRTPTPPKSRTTSLSFSDGYNSADSEDDYEKQTSSASFSPPLKKKSDPLGLSKIDVSHLSYEINVKTPIKVDYSEIYTFLETIFWRRPDGTSGRMHLREWKEKQVTVKRICMDFKVCGQETKNLLPIESSEAAKTFCSRNDYEPLQKSIGLNMDENGKITEDTRIGKHVEKITFGCSCFPEKMIGICLAQWTFGYNNLEYISISWRVPLTDRRMTLMKMDIEYLGGRMEHIWRRSMHSSSPFSKANISKYDEDIKNMKNVNNDPVDMYILYSNDGEHMAVLSISDVAITIHCGFPHGKRGVPLLKQAFANVTQIENDFYEIVERNIPKKTDVKLMPTSKNFVEDSSDNPYENGNEKLKYSIELQHFLQGVTENDKNDSNFLTQCTRFRSSLQGITLAAADQKILNGYLKSAKEEKSKLFFQCVEEIIDKYSLENGERNPVKGVLRAVHKILEKMKKNKGAIVSSGDKGAVLEIYDQIRTLVKAKGIAMLPNDMQSQEQKVENLEYCDAGQQEAETKETETETIPSSTETGQKLKDLAMKCGSIKFQDFDQAVHHIVKHAVVQILPSLTENDELKTIVTRYYEKMRKELLNAKYVHCEARHFGKAVYFYSQPDNFCEDNGLLINPKDLSRAQKTYSENTQIETSGKAKGNKTLEDKDTDQSAQGNPNTYPSKEDAEKQGTSKKENTDKQVKGNSRKKEKHTALVLLLDNSERFYIKTFYERNK